MNYSEYLKGADAYYQEYKDVLRKGQAYFNYLQRWAPRITRLIESRAMAGEEVDPYYDDKNLTAFLSIVYDELESWN